MRAMIREDMANGQNRRNAVRSLLKAQDDFRRGEILPVSALDIIDTELDTELR
jgi:antitoxin ParD1/3/4